MGSAIRTSISLYKKLRNRGVLYGAWKHVYDAGRSSTSPETVRLVNEFLEDQHRNIERIQEELRRGKFRFDPALGIAKKRPGKGPRPIVVGTVRNRIVQRAILDVLQGVPTIRDAFLNVETSFGGIASRSVKHAIAEANKAIAAGATYYARSDIRDFYRKIPRERALSLLHAHIDDVAFRNILRDATTTELANLAEVRDNAALFPLGEIGVAQGSPLSTLIGNALLCDFDLRLNGRGIVCLRYIDDFIIFGRTKEHVHKAFLSALSILSELGLSAYNPWDASNDGKAERGFVDRGFEFLGCEIRWKDGAASVSPSAKKQQELLGRVNNLLEESERAMRSPLRAYRKRMTLIPTLHKLSNTLEGWGKSYGFCNNNAAFQRLDAQIEARVRTFFQRYQHAKTFGTDSGRWLRGVHILAAVENSVPRQRAPASQNSERASSESPAEASSEGVASPAGKTDGLHA